jgi:DNA-binding NarL/FixJ family response regulator
MAVQKKVLILEPSAMFRDMLTALLAKDPELKVVEAVGTIAEAVSKLREYTPDILLSEVSMPDGSGIELAKELKTTRSPVRVIFTTSSESEDTILKSLASRAEGLVFKSFPLDALLLAIKAVCFGNLISYPASSLALLSSAIQSHLTFTNLETYNGLSNLSRREKEIANLLMQGLTYQEIANTLCVSINTVKTHIKRIYKQLNITSRRDLNINHLLVKSAIHSNCNTVEPMP